MSERVAASLLRAARSLLSCIHPVARVRGFEIRHGVIGATTLDRCQVCGAIRLGAGLWVSPHGVVVLSGVLGDGAPREPLEPTDLAELLLVYECELSDSTGDAVLMPREHLRALLSACVDARYCDEGECTTGRDA